MKKKLINYVACFIALIMMMEPISCFSEAFSTDESSTDATVHLEKIDTPEALKLKQVEWKNQLHQINSAHKEADLTREKIQADLAKKGLSGLSKYQYLEVLKDEKEQNFSNNELLIVFSSETERFSTPEFNALFQEFRFSADLFHVGTLKKEYSSSEILDLIEKLMLDPNVELIQPNFIYTFAEHVSRADYTSTLTQAAEQVNATSAWNYATGKGVLVGMVDTGMNCVYNWVTPHSDSTLEVIDDESDESNGQLCYEPACFGHGTAVSTVIGGNGPYAGVAPESTICCKGGHYHYTNEEGMLRCDIYEDSLLEYLNELLSIKDENGKIACKVINLSVGGEDADALFDERVKNSGVLFVKSAGNLRKTDNGIPVDLDTLNLSYPDYSNVIVVGSVNTNDQYSGFSYYGNETVHIAAPGEDLYLPSKDGDNRYWNGTSFSAPFVSGTAALLWELNPNLTAAQVKTYILNSADIIPGLSSKVIGGRRLNVMAAIEALGAPHTERYAYLDSNGTLYARDRQNPSYIQIATNVQSYQLGPKGILYVTNNRLYFKNKTLTASPVLIHYKSAEDPITSFAASWDNLVVHNGYYLYRYRYNHTTGTYDYNIRHQQVRVYSLCGNRLITRYDVVNRFSVFENITPGYPTEFTQYWVTGTITGIWTAGSRIHIYQENGLYDLYDSKITLLENSDGDLVADNTFVASLSCIYEMDNFTYLVSMNQTLFCTVKNGDLYVYDSGGNRTLTVSPRVINSTAGNITQCKIINYRIYYCVNSIWYVNVFEDNGTGTGLGSYVTYQLTGAVANAVFCGDNIGYRTSASAYWIKTGAINAGWSQQKRNNQNVLASQISISY